MSMRDEWVQTIFQRLTAIYGVRFLNAYGDMAPELVRASWAEALGGMTSGDVSHALNHLDPDWPPNALQFRKLAQGRPRSMPKALPAPKANPARVRELVDRMQQAVKGPTDSRAWARALRERNQADLTQAQRVAWKTALRERDTGDTSTAWTDETSIYAGFQRVPLPTLQSALQSDEGMSDRDERDEYAEATRGNADFDPRGAGQTGGRGPAKKLPPPPPDHRQISDPDTVSTNDKPTCEADFWETP